MKQEKRKEASSDSDFEAIEGELDRDIKERDELAARIRKREKEKTRNVLEQKRKIPDNKVPFLQRLFTFIPFTTTFFDFLRFIHHMNER